MAPSDKPKLTLPTIPESQSHASDELADLDQPATDKGSRRSGAARLLRGLSSPNSKKCGKSSPSHPETRPGRIHPQVHTTAPAHNVRVRLPIQETRPNPVSPLTRLLQPIPDESEIAETLSSLFGLFKFAAGAAMVLTIFDFLHRGLRVCISSSLVWAALITCILLVVPQISWQHRREHQERL